MPGGERAERLLAKRRLSCQMGFERSVHASTWASKASGNESRQALSDAFHRRSDGHAAVDGIDIAGGEDRLVRGEKYDNRRDLLGLGEPPHGLARDERLARLDRIGESADAFLQRWRVYGPRRDGVAADALGDEIRRDRF